MEILLVLGLAMARCLRPNTHAATDFSMGVKDTERLEQLSNRLWNRLLTEPREPLDWRGAHAFFLEIERPGWPRLRRRVRHLRILLSRVIGPDYAFAARFGLRREWQVHMLRPARLLCEAIRPTRRKMSRIS